MKLRYVLHSTLIFTCFYALNAVAMSEPKKTYDIEVLIFSHITPKTLPLEQWPLLSNDTIHAFDQINPSVKTVPATHLLREEKSIQHDAHYRVLLHAAWRGTWAANHTALVFPIRNETGRLTGIISIKLDHYFNTRVNLLLTESINDLTKIDTSNYFKQFKQSTFTFQLLQDQRMRSNELNYIGNSLMGMLIKITPISTQP